MIRHQSSVYDDDSESTLGAMPSKKIKPNEILSAQDSLQEARDTPMIVIRQISSPEHHGPVTSLKISSDQDIFDPLDHYEDASCMKESYLWGDQNSDPIKNHPLECTLQLPAGLRSLNGLIRANYEELAPAQMQKRSWLWQDVNELDFFPTIRSSVPTLDHKYSMDFDKSVKQP